MKKIIIFIVLICILLLPSITMSHPGRTDSYGCHTCRTNCASWGLSTGEYHCHRAKALPQPIQPVKSKKSDTGVGITIPAPEYRAPKVEVKKIIPPKATPLTTPVLDTNNDKEKALINAVENMPKTTQAEKISLFQKIFRLIFGN